MNYFWAGKSLHLDAIVFLLIENCFKIIAMSQGIGLFGVRYRVVMVGCYLLSNKQNETTTIRRTHQPETVF